jgi:hypothetical protein
MTLPHRHRERARQASLYCRYSEVHSTEATRQQHQALDSCPHAFFASCLCHESTVVVHAFDILYSIHLGICPPDVTSSCSQCQSVMIGYDTHTSLFLQGIQWYCTCYDLIAAWVSLYAGSNGNRASRGATRHATRHTTEACTRIAGTEGTHKNKEPACQHTIPAYAAKSLHTQQPHKRECLRLSKAGCWECSHRVF